jgi:hypothetical protein
VREAEIKPDSGWFSLGENTIWMQSIFYKFPRRKSQDFGTYTRAVWRMTTVPVYKEKLDI